MVLRKHVPAVAELQVPILLHDADEEDIALPADLNTLCLSIFHPLRLEGIVRVSDRAYSMRKLTQKVSTQPPGLVVIDAREVVLTAEFDHHSTEDVLVSHRLSAIGRRAKVARVDAVDCANRIYVSAARATNRIPSVILAGQDAQIGIRCNMSVQI